MKGDNEISIGRNMGQGKGFVCQPFIEIACYRLKDSNALREIWRERKLFYSFSTTAPFSRQARQDLFSQRRSLLSESLAQGTLHAESPSIFLLI